jgi:hypothetical protein
MQVTKVFVTIVMSIPGADVTARFRGKFGPLRTCAESTLAMALTALGMRNALPASACTFRSSDDEPPCFFVRDGTST